MQRDRFTLILRYLHFIDNEDPLFEKDDDDDDDDDDRDWLHNVFRIYWAIAKHMVESVSAGEKSES